MPAFNPSKPWVFCNTCGKPFRVHLHIIKRNGGKYCSRPCKFAYKNLDTSATSYRPTTPIGQELVMFLESSRRTSWIQTPEIKVYVRKGHHSICGELTDTLDIASVEVSSKARGTGVFRGFIQFAESIAPVVYVESILNQSLLAQLVKHGYQSKNYEYPPTLYKICTNQLTEEFMKTNPVQYKGITHHLRLLETDGVTWYVGSISLDHATTDNDGEALDDIAQAIDDKVRYYVPDSLMSQPDAELLKYIDEHLEF